MLNCRSRRRLLSSSTSPCQRDRRSVSCCRTPRRGGSWVSTSVGAKPPVLAMKPRCTGSEPHCNPACVGMVSTKECDELLGDVSMQRRIFFFLFIYFFCFFEKSLFWEGRKMSQFSFRVLRTNSCCLHQPDQPSLTVKPQTLRCSEPGNITQCSMEKSIGTQRSWKLLGLGLLLTWLDNKKTQQMPGGGFFSCIKRLGRRELPPMWIFSFRGKTEHCLFS